MNSNSMPGVPTGDASSGATQPAASLFDYAARGAEDADQVDKEKQLAAGGVELAQAASGASGASGASAESDYSGSAAGAAQKPPKGLSPSGASMFEQCPRRWRFRYVDRIPDMPGVSAVVGTFAHRVLELLLRERSSERTLDRAKRLARSIWAEFSQRKDYRYLGLDEQKALEFRWRAWTAIEGLWVLEDPASVQVRDVEVRIDSQLGEVPFRGVVDRVDVEPDGLVVTDYKSGRYPPVRVHPDRLRQVMMYAAALQADTGETPVRVRLYYLGQNSIDSQVTEQDLSAVVEELTSTWNAILEACESDVFEPVPNRLCEYCSYVELCPEGQADIARRAAEKAAEEESLLRLAPA